MTTRKKHDEIVRTALKPLGVKKTYADLEKEFDLLKEMISVRSYELVMR